LSWFLQILAKSQTSWKKLLVFLKENVAIPFLVDTTVLNSDVQIETGEVGTATEQLNELIGTPSLEVGLASEIQERDGLYTQQSQLKDEL